MGTRTQSTSGTTVSVRGLCPPVWSGTRHVPDGIWSLAGRQTGWMVDQISTYLIQLSKNKPQNRPKTSQRMPTNCQKRNFFTTSTTTIKTYIWHFTESWWCNFMAACKYTETEHSWVKYHQEKLIRQRNKSASTAAYGKGSLSFCQHQCLVQMPAIPHVAMVSAGWDASDIILTTSATGSDQPTYSNIDVKMEPVTQICVSHRWQSRPSDWLSTRPFRPHF